MTLSFRILGLGKEAKKKSPEENHLGYMGICYNTAFYNSPRFREKEGLIFLIMDQHRGTLLKP